MSKCQETAGFLISAPCAHKATRKCQACGKPLCEIHSRDATPRAGVNCIACHRKFGARYEHGTDDPYLYSGYFYHSYYEDYDYGDTATWVAGREAFEELEKDSDLEWEGDFDGS